MAVLHVCSCSNPECDCMYVFTGNGIGLSRGSYRRYHGQITAYIASGKYGEALRQAMGDPESIYLDMETDYSYCPVCDELNLGGKIAVWLQKEGKPAQLGYDSWNESCYLEGFCEKENYRKVLQVPVPCWRCGGEKQYYEDFEDMHCPKCGSKMKDGELDWQQSRANPEGDWGYEEEVPSEEPSDEEFVPSYELPDIEPGGFWEKVRRAAAEDQEDDEELSLSWPVSTGQSPDDLTEEDGDDWWELEELPELTVESLAAYHHVDPSCVRIGETPDGGAYAIVTEIGERLFISEFDENHEEIMHTSGYFVQAEESEELDEISEGMVFREGF